MEKKLDTELERLKQAITFANSAHTYDGNLVAELLVHLGCIHSTRVEMQRWGARL